MKSQIAIPTIATLLAALVFGSTAHAAPDRSVSGEVLVPISYVAGLKEDGSLDPVVTAACEKKYKDVLGEEVFVSYEISPTLNKAVALVEDTEVTLGPLGIPETYSFTSDKMPDILRGKGFLRVIFTMEDDFDDEVVHIIAMGEDPKDNCFLSTEAFVMRQ